MHLPTSLFSLTLLLLSSPAIRPSSAQDTTASPNPKRGLVYVPNSNYPQDNYIWTRPPTTLTWYYNYGSTPSAVFNNISQSAFSFVPMLWGAPADISDTTWLTEVRSVIAKGTNITHVMGFNEPDGPSAWGGSDVKPAVAAQVWVNNIIPLQETEGLKVGLPAPTGGWGGIPWLNQFLGNCSSIVSRGLSSPKNCTFDFVPIHWYGDFGSLASHIGTYAAAFPGTKIWVTEWNYDNQDLSSTQEFVRMALEYMDRIDDVERYSIFAAFRSTVSNVGPNASMLSAGGQLTEIGTMYLGRNASTAVAPDNSSPKGSGAASSLRGAMGAQWSLGAVVGVATVVGSAVALVF